MAPQLIIVDGPTKGLVFPLAEGETTVGRFSTNQICLSSPLVSRQHCTFRREQGGVSVRDLDSLNGTFIGNVPIGERLLQHGDEIRVGDCRLLFLAHDVEGVGAPMASEEAERPESVDPASQTVHHSDLLPFISDRSDDASWTDQTRGTMGPDHPASAAILAKTAASRQLERELQAIVQIAKMSNSNVAIKRQAQWLAEAIIGIAPAARCAIAEIAADREEVQWMCRFDKTSVPERAFEPNGGLIDRVRREAKGFIDNNAPAPASSILAVPIRDSGEVRGFIYLEAGEDSQPFDESHLDSVRAVAEVVALAFENARWRVVPSHQRQKPLLESDHNIIGESPAMERLNSFISKVAPTESTVLICGESGTGKELVASSIHANSPRRNHPFAAINCAALSESLLESELFGYEKGAFTGALQQKKGKLEAADGGTVFLDEIGEFAPPLQAKLLRALQESEFHRVGGTRPVKVDVRFIAATNRDLKQAVRSGEFREDLYYRLNVVSITVPPLRDRREDIPLLATYFLACLSAKTGRKTTGLSPKVRACLKRYRWPGNVRELQNALERAVVLGSSGAVRLEDLPEALLEMEAPADEPTAHFHEALRETKKRLILDALARTDRNFTKAARLLGVNGNYLHRLVTNLNLRETITAQGKSRD